MDGDGFADLAVGCPFSSGPADLIQAGRVMVFASSAYQAGQELNPTWIGEGSVRSAWFGHSLRVPPKSGLLLVGSPDAAICQSSFRALIFTKRHTKRRKSDHVQKNDHLT